MSTESIQNPSKTLSKHYESYGVFPSIIAGATIGVNQEVYISANNTVTKRSVGTQFPIGICTKGGVVGELVTIQANILRDTLGIAKGGTINAGVFVKPNGNVNANGIPEFVAAVAGDYANAIVLAGGAVDTEIKVWILRSAHIVPA